MTSSLKRLAFARLCIEIGIDDSLPNSLDLVLEDGSLVEILIEYNWVPKRCSICKEFGHHPKFCKKASHLVWVPKEAQCPPKTIPNVAPNRRDVPILHSSPPMAQRAPPSMAQDGPRSLASPRILLRSSVNRFAALSPADDPFGGADDPFGGGDDPLREAGDPFGSGVGDPIAKDDPIADPFGESVGDPLCIDDPIGSVAGDPNEFDDPTVPKASSSVPPVGDSSALSPTIRGSVVSSPSSSSSFSTTPLIARRLKMVDELEIKQGKQMKHKKKNRSAGNSKGKISLKLDD